MNIESRERLAVLIKQARGGMTKSSFAEMLGVSHTAVGSWEKGDFLPDVRSLAKISEILDISIEELLARIEGKTRAKDPNSQTPSKLGYLRQEVKTLRTSEFVELYRSMTDIMAELAIAKRVGSR